MATEIKTSLSREHGGFSELCLIRASRDQGPETRGMHLVTCPQSCSLAGVSKAVAGEVFLHIGGCSCHEPWARLHPADRGNRDMALRTTLGAP